MTSDNSFKSPKELREALEKEGALFERYYLWLEESMPELFLMR